ncbi:MAG: hypothetical protein ABI203_04620, partial [Mucilaginibacter sp.]
MKKKSIGFIIGLMGFALLGVMSMQLYFLRQSYEMQSDLFDRSVNDALNNVVSKLAKQDAISFLNKKAQVFDRQERRTGNGTGHRAFVSNVEDNRLTPQAEKAIKRHMTARERRLNLLHDSLKQAIESAKQEDDLFNMAQSGELRLHIKYEEYTDEFGNIHQRMTDPKIVRGPANPAFARRPTKLHKYDTLLVDYIDPQFGKQAIPVVQVDPLWQREQERKRSERRFNEVKKMLEADSMLNVQKGSSKSQVIENLADEYQKSDEPLAKRLSPFWIDSLLRFELHNRGIFLPFNYSVSTFNSDSLIFSSVKYTADDGTPILQTNVY